MRPMLKKNWLGLAQLAIKQFQPTPTSHIDQGQHETTVSPLTLKLLFCILSATPSCKSKRTKHQIMAFIMCCSSTLTSSHTHSRSRILEIPPATTPISYKTCLTYDSIETWQLHAIYVSDDDGAQLLNTCPHVWWQNHMLHCLRNLHTSLNHCQGAINRCRCIVAKPNKSTIYVNFIVS